MWIFWFCALAAVNAAVWIIHAVHTRRKFAELRAENELMRDKDEKIFRLYQNIEAMLDSFEAYVGEVHGELELRRTELLEISRQATTLYMQGIRPSAPSQAAPSQTTSSQAANIQTVSNAASMQTPFTYAAYEATPISAPSQAAPSQAAEPYASQYAPPARKVQPEPPGRLSSRDRHELAKLSGKNKKVRFLMGRGLSVEETARELGIGKGEVLLIVDLDK